MHHADSMASLSAAMNSDWAGKERSVRRGKLREYNQQHARTRTSNSALAARIASYELAYRMQSAAPDAVELSQMLAERQKVLPMCPV